MKILRNPHTKNTMNTTPPKTPIHSQKSKSFLLPIGLALATLAILPAANGQLIYSNGFETSGNYSTGNLVGQGTNGGDIKNWTASLNGGTAKIVTSSTWNSTTMNPATGSQMLQAQYGNSSLSLNQLIVSSNNTIKQDFNYTFKLAVQEDALSNAAIYVGIRSSAATAAGHSNGMDFGLLRYSDGNGGYELGFAARQSNPGGPSYATRIGTDTAPLNEWLTFSLDLDWSSLTYSGTAKDSSNNLITSFSNVAIWDKNGTMSSYGFDQLGVYVHQVGDKPYFLVDDMSVTLVPEPSAIALALLGGAAIAFYRRRNKASKS